MLLPNFMVMSVTVVIIIVLSVTVLSVTLLSVMVMSRHYGNSRKLKALL